MINKITGFFSEVRGEFKKVTWPTREELISSTSVVLVTMVIISVFIGVCDFVLSYAMTLMLH